MSILEKVKALEFVDDPSFGRLYIGSAKLTDNSQLDCVLFSSKEILVDLAKRRIKEELEGKGFLGGDDSYGQIVSSFVVSGTRIAEYNIKDVGPSKYALPMDIKSQIVGETFMGWTGWVFEMNDGKLFQFGTSFFFYFFGLPAGYSFSDIVKVHNHSYLNEKGDLTELARGAFPPSNYDMNEVYQARIHFDCPIAGI